MSRESTRFAMLVCSMWVAAAMGIMWSFGVISNELKEKYQISQSTMTWITTSGSAFGMFGLPAGLVFDFFGPPGALLIGGTITGLGSAMLSFALYSTDSLGGYDPLVVKSLAADLEDWVLVGDDDNSTTTSTSTETTEETETTTNVTTDETTTTTTSAPPTPVVDKPEAEPAGAVALIFIGYIFLLHGTTYLDVGGVMATLFVFPLDRGDVIMLTRTLTGLGGTFFVFLFNGFFVSKLIKRNPFTESSAKIYGQYMFACTAIIFAVCWLAALVIRYPIYHTSGFALWKAKRKINAQADDLPSSSPHDAVETLSKEAELAKEKDATKQYYNTIRAAPRRKYIGLFTLGAIFVLFTTIAFMKAAKEKLPDDLVKELFGPDGNRAVSITSIVLLAAMLPLMALPARKSQVERADEGFAEATASPDDGFASANSGSPAGTEIENNEIPCYYMPGHVLDSRPAPKTENVQSSTGASNKNEGVDEDEDYSTNANERTGLVSGSNNKGKGVATIAIAQTTAPAVVVNPTFHKNACQHKTNFKDSITKVPLMWSLMCMAFVSWGAGATILSNSAQILRAANDNKFDEDLNNLMASVVGVATALGRIFVGVVDRYYYHQTKYSSSIALPVGPASMLIGALLIVVLPARVCYFGVAFTAFGYGLSWASTMLLVREAFEKDIGRVYYMCSTTAVVSVIAFNRGLFGTVFDERGKEQGIYPNCSGIECVRLPMLVGVGLFALGTICAVVTYFQWRRRLLASP